MKKTHYLILGEGILFSLLAYIVYKHPILAIDQIVYEWIAQYLINDTITKLMKFITFFGSPEGVILINILLYLLIKDKKFPALITVNLITCLASYKSIKTVIKRARPPWIHLVKEGGYSFPSGHMSISFALYGAMIVYLSHSTYRYKKQFIAFLSCLIFLIGFSRIYLGVHFFSDIMGATLLGLIFLQIENLIIQKKD